MISIHQEKRPCLVGSKREKALFYGVFQNSYVVEPSPLIGGHPGGVVAYPIAVVELENGSLKTVIINDIYFIDREFENYSFEDMRK